MGTTSIVKTAHGPMRVFDNDPWVSRCLRELGDHCPGEVHFLGEIIQTLANAHGCQIEMVEAGSYIGDHTIPLARLVGHLHAFEPQEIVRELLVENLEMNGIRNVTVYPYALGHEHKMLRFMTAPIPGSVTSDWLGSMQMTDDGDGEAECRTLDSFGLNPHLIKADMEGMETMLLAGGLETLQRTRCPLFLEYDTVMLKDGPLLQDTLLELGYYVYMHQFPLGPKVFGEIVSKMLYAVPPCSSILSKG